MVIGFKLVAGAIASNAFTGVAIGVGIIFSSLVYSVGRNPTQSDELVRYSFLGFSLVEASVILYVKYLGSVFTITTMLYNL